MASCCVAEPSAILQKVRQEAFGASRCPADRAGRNVTRQTALQTPKFCRPGQSRRFHDRREASRLSRPYLRTLPFSVSCAAASNRLQAAAARDAELRIVSSFPCFFMFFASCKFCSFVLDTKIYYRITIMSRVISMARAGAPKKPAKDVKQVMAFRVKPGLRAALKKAAADDSRTPTALAEKILSDWLKDRNYLK
jgi:hypothetical protein